MKAIEKVTIVLLLIAVILYSIDLYNSGDVYKVITYIIMCIGAILFYISLKIKD